MDDEAPHGALVATLEYAVERNDPEASSLEILYDADVVGVVPPSRRGEKAGQAESPNPFDIRLSGVLI